MFCFFSYFYIEFSLFFVRLCRTTVFMNVAELDQRAHFSYIFPITLCSTFCAVANNQK